MADDNGFQYFFASGSAPAQQLSSDPQTSWHTGDLLSLAGLGDEADYGSSGPAPGQELIGETTAPTHTGPAPPDVTFGGGTVPNYGINPLYLTAENPTDPPQGSQPPESLHGFESSAGDYAATYNDQFDAGNRPPALASDPLHVPTTTHGVGSSSGYGPSQALSDARASTGEPQATPSPRLRMYRAEGHKRRSTQWRANVLHVYSIEITQECLGLELWNHCNGQIYINQSTYNDPNALYLRIDARISESTTNAPQAMCAKCYTAPTKPYPHQTAAPPAQAADLDRIYCNWQLQPLTKIGNSFKFKGNISFYIFCHPSHTGDKKASLRPFRMTAKLFRVASTPSGLQELAECDLAEEMISRTEAKNKSTVQSRSNLNNSGSTVSDRGEPEVRHPDRGPPESTSRPAPQLDIPRPSSAAVTTLASAPPVTPSILESPPSPLLFVGITPNRGYGGQSVKFYGGAFSQTVQYYAKFGELEPTPMTYRCACLLEGEVPERDTTGPVAVSIVNKEGYAQCHTMQRFVYIDKKRKDAEELIRLAYDKVDPADALRDAEDVTRRLKGSKKRNGAGGSTTREPNSQTRQCGAVTGAETDETLNVLEHAMEPTDTSMQDLTNQEKNANLNPSVFLPSRTWTDASAATSTTVVATSGGTNTSLKAIKASSRKPTPHSIVSKWLRSDYGSESGRKRRRARGNWAHVGESGVGGSLVGSINLLLSPEQVNTIEMTSPADEDPPVILMDASRSDQQAVRALKRRRVEGAFQTLADPRTSPLP